MTSLFIQLAVMWMALCYDTTNMTVYYVPWENPVGVRSYYTKPVKAKKSEKHLIYNRTLKEYKEKYLCVFPVLKK